MSRGQLHHILTNPIYAGRIRHKSKVFAGQHEAIIDPKRWNRVQKTLQEKSAKPRKSKHHRDPSPLAGKIYDGAGERLTPSHTKKGARRYRYYISKRLVTGVTGADQKQQTWRIPAVQIEGPVQKAVQQRISELHARASDQMVPEGNADASAPEDIWDVIERETIEPGSICVRLDEGVVRGRVPRIAQVDPEALTITLPFGERRRGVEMRVVAPGATNPDEALQPNIAIANRWYTQIKQGACFEDIAAEAGTSKRRVQQVIGLALLSPKIVEQIMLGTQPVGLTSDWLIRHELPTGWALQQECIAAL